MTKVDRNISYKTEPLGNGFLLTMHYEKMQYAPDLAGLTIACRSNLMSLAHELASKRKRAIKNVNEQRIKIQATRHVEGPNGIDYCVASVPVEWK